MRLSKMYSVLAGSVIALLFFTGVGTAACVCANQLCQLNEEQSALYLTCTMIAQGAQIPASLTSNFLGAFDLLAMDRTMEFQTVCGTTTVSKLPALNGLTYLQLGTEQVKAVGDFAVEQYPFMKPGKAKTQIITSFETMNNASCATRAGNFIVPTVPRIKLSTNSLNFSKVPVSGFSFLSFQIVNLGTPLLTGKVDESKLNAAFSPSPSPQPFSEAFSKTYTVSVIFQPPVLVPNPGL